METTIQAHLRSIKVHECIANSYRYIRPPLEEVFAFEDCRLINFATASVNIGMEQSAKKHTLPEITYLRNINTVHALDQNVVGFQIAVDESLRMQIVYTL